MAKELIQVPAQITDFKPKADRSYKLSFETRELSGKEVAILADNFQGEGWLLFRTNGEIKPEEIPTDIADAGTKSPSQRLRAHLYVLWKQRDVKVDFESFYRTSVERYIEEIQARLEPND